ncbi:MAG: hypothetical protein SH859_10875 [Hyphomicrobium aestuarii]|nr:hypothetical protein [Hyphomicrobium aestuarii]
MAYRGEDLDLRTPQTWGPPDMHGGESPSNGRSRLTSSRAPILVDEVVLACCNHAFDVAAAHRATDVRIEHLLHAMTRIDVATSALETRGLRVAGLRRESATIVASEIPIGLGSGQTRPRRSDDLELLLRAASNYAARRNAPANVDDVVDALLDMPSDIPGITLLARHGGRSARDRMPLREASPSRDASTLRASTMALPPLSRSGLATDLRGDFDADRRTGRSNDWSRSEPSRDYPARDYAPREYPARDHTAREYLGSSTDGIQNARIDQLETALRALTNELANERSAVSGIVLDLQRNLSTERDDTSRFRGGLDNRLGALERAVLDTRGSDEVTGRLLDRLSSIEEAVLDPRQRVTPIDLSPIQDRLAQMERAVRETMADGGRLQTTLVDRLKQIERAVEITNSKPVDVDGIINRLDIIEEAVLSSDSSKVGEALAERLRAMDDAMAAQRTAYQQATASLAAEIKTLTSSLAVQSGNADRVQSLTTERLQALAAGFERQRADVLNGVGERLTTLAATIDGRLQQAAQPLAERLTAVATAFDGRMQAATQPLTERLGALDSQIKSQLAPMVQRLTALEAQLTQSVERTMELQTQHATELKEVHEALLKLNTNQHTLAGSIDQWRLDGVGDVSVIANRLASIETTITKPNELLQQLTTNVDNIGRATVERYHRRNRFWYWLFGTDDWLSASWPSQVAAIETERQALRGSGARSTPQVPR